MANSAEYALLVPADGGKPQKPQRSVLKFYFYFLLTLAVTLSVYFQVSENSIFDSFYSNEATRIDGYSICSQDNYNFCHKPFFQTKSWSTYSLRYKLNLCTAPKSLSTILSAVMCYLYDPEDFVLHNRTINSEYATTAFCKDRNTVLSLKELSNLTDFEPDWTHVFVVREPLERFISGFLDKCVAHPAWKEYHGHCFGCKSNLECFLQKLDEAMSNAARVEPNFDTHHFYPQNWRCEIGPNMYHMYKILHIQRDNSKDFWKQFIKLISAVGVEREQLDYISDQVTQSTNHSTFKLSREKNRLKNELMSNYHNFKLFIKIYFYDFVLFGFPLPVGQF